MRFAELNYVIRFKRELLDKVISGRKSVTIRWGIVYPRRRELIIVSNDHAYGIARIIDVKYVKVRDLPDDVIRDEGFRSLSDLISSLKSIYPNIKESDYVTVIRFRVERVFRSPKKLIDVIDKLKSRE